MKLRVYRSISNLTQKQLARRLGVTELSVIKYEAGNNIPSRDVMLKIYVETEGAVTPNDFYDLEQIGLSKMRGVMNSTNEALVCVGLMSGTSMDGIDACVMSTDGEAFIKNLGSASLSYEANFKKLLKAAERSTKNARGDLTLAATRYEQELEQYLIANGIPEDQVAKEKTTLAQYLYGENKPLQYADVIKKSTELHAEAVRLVLADSGFEAKEIDLIGYHGQTLYHRPADGITIQAGDIQLLADLTGIPVVGDFRSNDVKHGGQGAPFAPLYHAALARQSGLAPVVIANCGGISNITVITRKDEELTAFDNGPGNALIDRYVFAKLGKACDLDGALGKQGKVNQEVMKALRVSSTLLSNGKNYLDQPPPKSLDINDLKLIPEVEKLSIHDACATLAAFTAECIVESLHWVEDKKIEVPRLWIVAGGGWENPVILENLTEKLTAKLGAEVRVQKADAVGWDGKALESQIFAYLAARSIKQLPLSVPGTTGVPTALSGGVFLLPAGKRASGRVKRFTEK